MMQDRNDVNPFLMDALESRTLLSASPVGVFADLNAGPVAMYQPLAAKALPSMIGRYTGTVKIPGVSHIKAVTVNITKQTTAGTFTGTMIPTSDTSIKIAITGKVLANHKFSITLKGTHSGGVIAATGSGSIGANNKTMTTTSLAFKQGGQSFPGSMVIKKA